MKKFNLLLWISLAPIAKASNQPAQNPIDPNFQLVLSSKIVGQTTNGKHIISSPSFVTETSSSAKREGKRYLLGAGYGFLTSQISLGYFYKPNLIVDFTFYEENDYLEKIATKYVLGLKGFLGNSFYIHLGLGYLRSYDLQNSRDLGGLYITQEKNNFAGLNGSLGNMWNWENMFIDVQWINLYFPLNNEKSMPNFKVSLNALLTTIGLTL